MTLGERNNNPGNVKYDIHTAWLGQTGHDAEGFCIFDAPLHGLRALCRVLVNYQRLDGCKTLADVIRRYAPFTENDTDAYLADVAGKTGIDPGAPLDLTQANELAQVARAIILHENADQCPYAGDLILAGAKLALAK